MRYRPVLFLLLILCVFGSAAPIAHASTYTVSCSISGNFLVADNVLKQHNDCVGDATIPAGVTSIQSSAFSNAIELTSVTFEVGSLLTTIGDSAFDGAYNLAVITIPAGVTSIGSRAFADVQSLTAIDIPAGVTSIGDRAFSVAIKLASVTFAAGSKLTRIGSYAFDDCFALTSISIPATVTAIGSTPFAGTRALTAISVQNGNTNYVSVDGVLFNKSKTQLIAYPAGKTASSYTVPTGVKSINTYAFSYAGLTSITIPPDVTSIGDYAFFYASGLTSISIPAKVATIGQYAFARMNSLKRVYFLGNKPVIGTDAFWLVTAATAYIRSAATGFPAIGADLAGLTVRVGVYNLIYETNGGTSISSGLWLRDVAITAPKSPTRTSFYFAGWSTSKSGSALAFPYLHGAQRDLTLYAKWTTSAPHALRQERRPELQPARKHELQPCACQQVPLQCRHPQRTPPRSSHSWWMIRKLHMYGLE